MKDLEKSQQGHTYKIKVDKSTFETNVASLTGREILELAGYKPEDYYLRQILKGNNPVEIKMDQIINLTDPGLERFVTIPKEAFDGGSKPILYKFQVDKKMLETESEYMTGSAILHAAGYTVTEYFLKQIVKGQPINIDPNQTVQMSDPGLERFVTIPKEASDGDGDFELFEEDVENLQNGGFQWETLSSNGNWLIVKKIPLPDGYNVLEADVAINIPTNYPQGKLDMAYFFPSLKRQDGIPIPQSEVSVDIAGKIFQRWSRHRNTIAWRVGVDSIITHIEEVKNWLQNEFVKRPRKDEAA